MMRLSRPISGSAMLRKLQEQASVRPKISQRPVTFWSLGLPEPFEDEHEDNWGVYAL